MSSNINPNNIDGAYPVAGQDNNSQGFRDNFTNIKTNFQYAETEINDLQSKVVLKAALTGTTLDNNMLGSPLVNATIRDFSATRVALGTLSGTVTVNYESGHYQTVTTNGNISLAFSNWPAASVQGWVTVRVTVASTAHTMTLPSAVGNGASAKSVVGIEGLSSNIITFAETGTYEFQFHTDDGGTTVYLSELTRPRNYFTNPLFVNSADDVASSAALSLATSISTFDTGGAETATLADGAEGQVKYLAMTNYGGNMVVTVASPGWGGSGTITLNATGDGCTLLFTSGAWYCVGNNSCVFA